MDDGYRGLRLWNTMSRAKDEFRPLDWRDPSIADADKRVRMYVCGPTVYDFAHIGNARPVIVFDVVFRLLRHLYGETHVTYVRNITDVEDKINARAARDFPDLPLNAAIAKVTETTAAQFHADAAALGCLPPTFEPRATEFVTPRADGRPDMVSMIATLIEKGHAYAANGEVLFDVASMPDYGRLSNRRLEENRAGARVAVDAHKRNPADFVLWKLSDENEPGWDSPWGRGRPGWHIECSAMAEAYLGQVFDIHGGGLDLIFPHHENEIAQSRCAHRTDAMAQVWMHNGFLQVEGRKMAKSEGNFVTIHDLLHTEKFGGRTWPGEVLRLAMLMTHYREPIDFTVKRLEEAEATLKTWKVSVIDTSGISFQEGNRGYYENFELDPGFIQLLSDDLNISSALPRLHHLSNSADLSDGLHFFATLRLLGLVTFDEMMREEAYDESAAVTDYMNLGMLRRITDERLDFIRAKNFVEADRIRAELLEKGIQLKDGKDPETGERVTTWELRR